MKAQLLDVDAPEWVSFLRRSRHDFYHLPKYVALCATHEQGEPLALYVTNASCSLLLPLVKRGIPGSDRTDVTSPYGYPGPLVCGTDAPEFLQEALVCGMETLLEAGVVSAFIRLHPLLNASPPQGLGTIVEHGKTVSVDLTLPNDMLWAQMRPNHRRDIRRAIQLGYVAGLDEAFEGFGSFKRLYRLTMARRSASPYYFFGDAYFDRLRDALGERLRLFTVAKDNAIAAAGLFVEIDGIVQYHLSGSADALGNVQPTKLMLDCVRRWGKQRGDRYLHLGGGVSGADDSLFWFKAGFSPQRHPFRTVRIVLDEGEYRRLVTVRDPLLDPGDRSAFFPQYRRA